jgi:hypothetical protein
MNLRFLTDEAFREIELRVEHDLFHGYRETGELLRQIRDDHQEQWRPLYVTWERYVEQRFGICRQTAAYTIRAAEVAADLSSRDDTLRLPVRHANLLARFDDSDVRLKLAIKIQLLPFKKAAQLVIDFSEELTNTATAPPPRVGRSDERNQALAQLDGILSACAALDEQSLAGAASRLGADSKRRLARRAKVAARTLSEVSAKLS